jgi:hypothetical protein
MHYRSSWVCQLQLSLQGVVSQHKTAIRKQVLYLCVRQQLLNAVCLFVFVTDAHRCAVAVYVHQHSSYLVSAMQLAWLTCCACALPPCAVCLLLLLQEKKEGEEEGKIEEVDEEAEKKEKKKKTVSSRTGRLWFHEAQAAA